MKVLVVLLLLIGITVGTTYLYTQFTGKTLSSVNPTGIPNTGAGLGGCANNYVPPTGFTCANLQAQYFVFDPLAPAGTGNGINGAQVSLSDPVSLASKDVPATTASTGLVTGGAYLISGQSYIGKVSTTNYVTEYPPIFVPAISNSAQQVTTINIPIPEVKTNTWSWSATGGGTTWSSTFSTYGYTAAGTTSVSEVFTFTANSNNQGYYSGYNPFNKVNDLMLVEFTSPSSPKTTMTSCQFSTTRNNVYTCQFLVPDGFTTINPNYSQGTSAITANFPTTQDGRYTGTQPKLQVLTANGVSVSGSASQQYVGTTVIAGTFSFAVNFNKGSLTTGSETWTMKVWLAADVLYFDGGGGYQQNGAYGGDQTQATLTGGNSPSIVLNV